MRFVGRIALVPLMLAVAASCSGGSSKATTPSTSPGSSTAVPSAKAAYVTTVNGLCRTMNSRVAALGTPSASDPIAEANLNDQTIAITTEVLGKIRAVTPPAGDADTVAAIYAKVDVVLTDARLLSTALRARDQTAAQAADTKLNTDSTTANDATIAYGLTVCGS